MNSETDTNQSNALKQGHNPTDSTIANFDLKRKRFLGALVYLQVENNDFGSQVMESCDFRVFDLESL